MIAEAVKKPLHVDMATKNQSRPNCKAKIEVDLLCEFSKRINVGIRRRCNGEILYSWVNIKYNYMPKHGKNCKL